MPSTAISIDSNMYRVDATLIFTVTHIKVFYYTATVVDYTALNFAIPRMGGEWAFSCLVYALLHLQNIQLRFKC